jgi:hypothetical protein
MNPYKGESPVHVIMRVQNKSKGESIMAHATQKFTVKKSTHKGCVRFELSKDTKHPMTNSMYLNREFADKELKCDDLDDVKGIEITVRILT